MSLGGSVSPWRSGVEEGRSPLGRFRKPGPCFPSIYAAWNAKKDENRFGSVKFRLAQSRVSEQRQNQDLDLAGKEIDKHDGHLSTPPRSSPVHAISDD